MFQLGYLRLAHLAILTPVEGCVKPSEGSFYGGLPRHPLLGQGSDSVDPFVPDLGGEPAVFLGSVRVNEYVVRLAYPKTVIRIEPRRVVAAGVAVRRL